MEAIEVKSRKWGSSIGVIIPKEIVVKEKIKKGQKLELIIRKPVKLDMKNVFGSLKDWKKPTEKIMREVDEELS